VSLSEKFYQDLFDNIDVGIDFVDKDRKIVYWSKGAEGITGCSATEVQDRSGSDNILVQSTIKGMLFV